MSKLRPVSYKTLAKSLRGRRLQLCSHRGDHVVFTKDGVLRPVVIPKYASIPVFIIKNNLRTAGMTRERYFELLGQS